MIEGNHTMGELVRTLERIENQVIKTNGRVSSLEKWRWLITGIAVAAAVMASPNIALIAKAVSGQ